jgi:hypothetical protein
MAGANATLHKPEDLEHLTAMIHAVIGSDAPPVVIQ